MASQISDKNGRKRIFIVDSHPMFRDALSTLVGRERDLSICGEASSAPEALTEIVRIKPDLVLLEISLPGRSGLELIKDLRALLPEITILVISACDEMIYAERVLRAGGRGFIMKHEGAQHILIAIRHVLDDQIYLNEKTSNRIFNVIAGRRTRNGSPINVLTDREVEILQLIGQGVSNHVIAARLNVSVRTVDAHRGNIKEKLNLGSATELICYATRWVDGRDSLPSSSSPVNVS